MRVKQRPMVVRVDQGGAMDLDRVLPGATGSVFPAKPLQVWLGGFAPVVEAGITVALGRFPARVVRMPASTDPAGADLLLLNPFAVPAEARERASLVPTVALLAQATASRMERAHKMRAVCVLSSEVTGTELVEALEAARLGRVRHSASRTELPAGPDGLLTPKELLVLTKICQGKSNDEIASEMAISINTVKTYVRISYRKIGTRKRTQAMLWGLEHGLGAPAGDHGPAQTDRTGA